MKVLKNILQYNYIFYTLLIISIIYTFININFISTKSKYNGNEKEIYGYITDYKIDGDKLTITLKSKEKLLVNYYFKIEKEKNNYNFNYGDYIFIKGNLVLPTDNTNFNQFNYRKYLLSQKIKYIFNADSIKLISKNNNAFYSFKTSILDRINKCKKSSNYLKTFLLADKNYIDNQTFTSYQNLGISHLLAVSGMHVSLISLILLKIFNKLQESIKYSLVSIILLFYLFLTNYTISMVRACFQFILFFINKVLKLNIKNSNIVIFLFSILLFYNPYNVYNVGFIFSFAISFSLITFNKIFVNKNIFYSLFMVSLISFLVSIPILVNNFYQINLLSIIYNMFYVPFVSYILFPFNLLTFMFPMLDNFNYIFINFFEKVSSVLSDIKLLCFDTSKIPMLFIIIYYIILIIFLKKVENKKVRFKNIILIVFLLIIFINYRKIVINEEITFINVGQGDSTLIRMLNENILIDTGGKIKYDKKDYQKRNKEYSLCNTLISFFKSGGVKKIDYLILTHGDFDHMGEAINLVENFNVEKVIFNCGEFNELENELIKVLNKKKIQYYSCIKELNIDDNKLYFLNNKDYGNENDNSSVIYTELNNHKFLFMGDAGVEVEEDLIKKYNLKDIDVLKVGHHGSRTSSSKEFINEINPKYSVISVGKNNRYGHPNDNVLDNLENLEDSKIYRTDEDGSIMFKIDNDKLKIKTCAP